MMIRDIRVVQKLKNRYSLKEVDGRMVIDRWVERTSFTLQIKWDGIFADEWEDVPVIEEFEEDS
jgi:hypothetical protein